MSILSKWRSVSHLGQSDATITQYVHRLERIYAVLGCLSVLGLGSIWAFTHFEQSPSSQIIWPQLSNLLILGLALLVTTTKLSWLNRLNGLNARGKVLLTLLLCPVICILLGLGRQLNAAAGEGVPLSLTWAMPISIVFAVATPLPWFFSIFRIAIAMGSQPILLFLTSSRFAGGVSPHEYAVLVINSLICAILAFLVEGIVHKVHRDASPISKIGAYEMIKELGHGGMGVVWLGQHQHLKRPAAIKTIVSENGIFREKSLTRFEREALATCTLSSAHTVQLYDYGRDEISGEIYYAMEYLTGLDLQQLVDKYGPIPFERVRPILLQICDSLQEAHEVGLIHRDIKPGNIFLTRSGSFYDFVKVLDFGLVAFRSPEASQDDENKLTKPGSLTGTPAFLAPEQAKDLVIDSRADIYALACVAYWLLSARYVFERNGALATALAHLTDTPPALSELSPFSIPAELDALLLRCLEKEAEDRPASALEFAEALKAIGGPKDMDADAVRRWWTENEPGLVKTFSDQRAALVDTARSTRAKSVQST